MGKTSTKDMLKGLFGAIEKTPKSISQICLETKLDRGAITKYVKMFVELKQIYAVPTKKHPKVFVLSTQRQLIRKARREVFIKELDTLVTNYADVFTALEIDLFEQILENAVQDGGKNG